MARKLKAIRQEMKARLHAPVKAQHHWLCQVLRGHYGYYGVIFNYRSLHAFYDGVKRSWFRALQRRSQKSRLNWQRFDRLLAVYLLPKPVIHQSWHKGARMTAGHLPEEPGAVTPHAGICGGESQ